MRGPIFQLYYIDLKEDGDFRSQESIAILQECDIVVTITTFRSFFVNLSFSFWLSKGFLIIEINRNAITYKWKFSITASNQMWLGSKIMEIWLSKYQITMNQENTFLIDDLAKKCSSLNKYRWFCQTQISENVTRTWFYAKKYNNPMSFQNMMNTMQSRK